MGRLPTCCSLTAPSMQPPFNRSTAPVSLLGSNFNFQSMTTMLFFCQRTVENASSQASQSLFLPRDGSHVTLITFVLGEKSSRPVSMPMVDVDALFSMEDGLPVISTILMLLHPTPPSAAQNDRLHKAKTPPLFLLSPKQPPLMSRCRTSFRFWAQMRFVCGVQRHSSLWMHRDQWTGALSRRRGSLGSVCRSRDASGQRRTHLIQPKNNPRSRLHVPLSVQRRVIRSMHLDLWIVVVQNSFERIRSLRHRATGAPELARTPWSRLSFQPGMRFPHLVPPPRTEGTSSGLQFFRFDGRMVGDCFDFENQQMCLSSGGRAEACKPVRRTFDGYTCAMPFFYNGTMHFDCIDVEGVEQCRTAGQRGNSCD